MAVSCVGIVSQSLPLASSRVRSSKRSSETAGRGEIEVRVKSETPTSYLSYPSLELDLLYFQLSSRVQDTLEDMSFQYEKALNHNHTGTVIREKMVKYYTADFVMPLDGAPGSSR